MIKRTSIENLNKTLDSNPNWKVLDVGCGYRAHPKATVISDIQDFSNFYKEKKFVRILEKKLPFGDNEFDFIIASHVIEHVPDFEFFISELERISSKGYIELPSRLADNLVYENEKDHIWWFKYNDVRNILLASKKKQLIEPFISVSTAKNLENIFRESLTIELMWEKKIDYTIDDTIRFQDIKKVTFFELIKKYLSKKIRSFYK